MIAAGHVIVLSVRVLIIETSVAVVVLANDTVALASWTKYITFPKFKLIAALTLAVTVCLIYAVEPAPVKPLPSPYNPPVAVRTPTLIFWAADIPPARPEVLPTNLVAVTTPT